jgi:hypothetical protein
MGSGFRTFQTAEVLTASNVQNYLMEQSVMFFASVSDRNTVITTPEDGMVAYIGSNDASEGLHIYNGTAWRQGPGWNAPWGIVPATAGGTSGRGYVANTSTQSGITAEVALTGMTITFTAIANRLYRLSYFEPNIDRSGGVSTGYFFAARLRYTNTSGTQLAIAYRQLSGTNADATSVEAIISPAAGSTVVIVSGQSENGTMNLNRSSTAPASFSIQDIGPAGAPA